MRNSRFTAALVAGLLLLAPTVSAQGRSEDEVREDARWLPGISVFSMGIPERRSAAASSDVRDDASGESNGFPWTVGAGAEIASPVLADIPGRPRLFMHGDVAYAVDTEDPVLTEGDVGSPPVVEGNPPRVEGITGVGQSVRAEANSLVLTGGVGSIFSFEAWDRTFHVRPSLEWMWRKDTIKALLGAGENELSGNVACGPCRTLFIETQTEKGYHSLGPGLELSVDAARAGDLLISFYGGATVYRILGDRKANLSATGAWERTDGQPTTRPDTTLDADYTRKPWHYRFGFGFRFSWLPE